MFETEYGAVAIVVVFIAVIFYGTSKINYLIDNQYLRIRVGPMALRKFAIDDIRDAKVGYSHWAEGWTNSIYPPTLSKKAVTIYRKSGKFKKILITPDDPTGFVERIKEHPRFVPSAP